MKPLYIRISSEPIARTAHMHFAPNVQMDLDKDDNLVGIEVLNYKQLEVDGEPQDTRNTTI